MKYQTKNLVLISGFLVILGLTYFFIIKRTINLQATNRELDEVIGASEDNLEKIEEYTNGLRKLDFKSLDGSDSTALDLMGYIGVLAKKEKVMVSSLEGPNSQIKKSFVIETTHLVLEGEFMPIVKMIKKLEEYPRIGKISSAGFYIKEKSLKNERKLYCSIYVQNIQFK